MTKSIKELVSALTKAEAGKSSIKVGDMREAIGKLADMMEEDPGITAMLLKLGKDRKKKKG